MHENSPIWESQFSNTHFFSNFPRKQYILFMFLWFVAVTRKETIFTFKWKDKSNVNICGRGETHRFLSKCILTTETTDLCQLKNKSNLSMECFFQVRQNTIIWKLYPPLTLYQRSAQVIYEASQKCKWSQNFSVSIRADYQL